VGSVGVAVVGSEAREGTPNADRHVVQYGLQDGGRRRAKGCAGSGERAEAVRVRGIELGDCSRARL